VPLGALATFQPVDTRSVLLRENQQQMIAMTADLADRSLNAVMRDVKAILAANPPPPGIRLEVGGQYASQQQAFRALILVLVLAAASVIAVMVIQFQSFIEPLVVLLAAPLSFVGAIGLLLITRTPLNVSSFMGLILLVGLIVKNGIILLDFTRHVMRNQGLALEPALLEAARIRLRPILMTTLCTLFGLLPLAFGLGCRQRDAASARPGGDRRTSRSRRRSHCSLYQRCSLRSGAGITDSPSPSTQRVRLRFVVDCARAVRALLSPANCHPERGVIPSEARDLGLLRDSVWAWTLHNRVESVRPRITRTFAESH
jgi:hypothetical protein